MSLYRIDHSPQEVARDGRARRLFRELWTNSRQHLQNSQPQLAIFAHDFVSHQVNVFGVYERLQLECISGWLQRSAPQVFKGVAVDIGANIGNHSVFFASRFRRVLCVEPNPRAFALLEMNTRCLANVDRMCCALGESQGRGRMVVPAANIGHGSVVAATDSDLDGHVAVRRLDDLIGQDEQVTLVKVDVEGHELQVMLGGAGVLARDRPVVVFEQLGDQIEQGTSPVIELLREIGYERFATLERFSRGLASNLPVVGRVCQVMNKCIPWKSRVFGTMTLLGVTTTFEPRDYPVVVAIPEWLDSTIER